MWGDQAAAGTADPMQPAVHAAAAPVQPSDAPDKPIESYPRADPASLVPPDAPVPAVEGAPGPQPAAAMVPAQPAAPLPVVLFLDTEANRKVLTLSAPVSIDGAIFTEVTVERPTAATIEAWASSRGDGTLNGLFERMSGLKAGVLNQLFLDDVVAIQGAANGFLPRALRPETSSSGS